MLENGSETCNCKRKQCVRHGKCNECIEYHKSYKRYPLPYCKGSKFNSHKKQTDINEAIDK